MYKYDSLILKGFNPDPSIIRVGDDFYIATSTFEWYPGVSIHHSQDLVSWKVISRPLDREDLLDMKGCGPHSGIWAPCLSYDHEAKLFYLVYTDVKWSSGSREFTGHNYVITARDITGPWSERSYLNSSGFDPSMFHDDDDGKKYIVNPRWDHRSAYDHKKYPFLKDIVLQEYDPDIRKLVGKPTTIFISTEIGLAEGPHIYKRDGYYYLVVAEGGTFYGHAVTISRSESIYGPYEVHPNNPILTSVHNPEIRLQKAGHASICDDKYGNLYMVHLCGRPLQERGNCILGRETAIQNIEFKDGWFQLKEGNTPKDTFQSPFKATPKGLTKKKYIFNSNKLDTDFMWLRRENNNYEFIDNKIRVYGKESMQSTYNKSFYARRLQHFKAEVETKLSYSLNNMQQYAGLVVYYDDKHYYNFRVTFNEETKEHNLNIVKVDKGKITYHLDVAKEIVVGEEITLKATIDHEKLTFSYNGNDIDEAFDMNILSDDYVDGFTGTFVGFTCVDISGQDAYADFEYFHYEELE